MSTSNPSRGMNQDTLPKFQPEGTYRMALNSIAYTEEGGMASLSTELGNIQKVTNFPAGKKIIGHVLNDKDEVILFLFDPAGNHEIGIYSPLSSSYASVYVATCLNFSLEYPINALFRVRNGCEPTIYFTDNYNRYRVMNLNEPPATNNCNLIAHSPDHTHPCINLKLNDGDTGLNDDNGSLQVGVYYFAFRYLDADRNPTDFFLHTRPVAVGDEPYSSINNPGTITRYDGGINSSASPYYVPPTTKSIVFRLTSLDNTNFSYLQMAVVKRTGDNGEITGVDVLHEVPITSVVYAKYIYTGNPTQVKFTSTLEEVLSTKLKIDKVKAHAQSNNILYLANTSVSTQRDYSTYQRHASKIKVEWVKDNIATAVDSYNKQAGYYFSASSFMEDEIYALGVVYVHSDGTLSPAFHIPGRPPDVVTGDNPYIGTGGVPTGNPGWDTGLDFSGDLPNPSKPYRYQNISTATKKTNAPLTGEMGFHQALNDTYPTIPTCDNHVDGYWGRDWNNGLIDNTVKIRHHRMPGPELRETAANSDGYKVGLRFTNLTYPPGVIRHFFVYCNDEPTILAKGVVIPLYSREPSGPFIFDAQRLQPEVIGVNATKTYAFISPENLLYPKYYSPKYFRLEKYYKELQFDASAGADNVDNAIVTVKMPAQSGGFDLKGLEIDTSIYNFTNYDIPAGSLNYNINSTFSAPKANYGSINGTMVYDPYAAIEIENQSLHISPQIVVFNRSFPEWITATETPDNRVAYGSLKADIDPYVNLFQLRYKRITNCVDEARTTGSLFEHYGGDTFSARVGAVDFTYQQSADGDPETEEKYIQGYFMNFLSQSTKVNFEFRHGSNTDPKYSYYRWNYSYLNGHVSFQNYLATKYYELTEDLMEMHLENYQYNKSFSFIDSLQEFFPPIYQNFCNFCTENSPYRVHFSEMDDVEQEEDAYRIIRPFSYRDSDTQYGEITDLFESFGTLYLTTPYNAAVVQTQPQTIATNETEVYIGAPSGLPYPFRYLKSSEQAFGGSQSFLSRTITQYGAFFMDSYSARPFIIDPKLNDLSMSGMTSFFQEQGVLFFDKQFRKLTGIPYPYITTTSPIGVGYISTYDPRYKRLIVTKRDYKLLPQWENVFIYLPLEEDDFTGEVLDPLKLYFNGFNFYFTNALAEPQLVDFSDPSLFENKSFTMSYSFDHKAWISFHSYLPTYMFNTALNFYSNEIYEHSNRPHLNFYGTLYPQIVDMCFPSQNREQVSALYYTSNGQSFNPTTETYSPNPAVTFNKLWVYNSNQSSGIMDLQLKDQLFEQEESNTASQVTLIDNTYRVHNFRDLTTQPNQPVSATSWNLLASSPFTFIDKVPNYFNLDFNKSMFEQSRFSDYFTGLRLYYYPSNSDAKLSLDIISTMTKNKLR